MTGSRMKRGYSCDYGNGGICDNVASSMGDVFGELVEGTPFSDWEPFT